MIFSTITQELQKELKTNMPQIRFLLKKNPAMGYTKITEIGNNVGRKYNIKLLVNFPEKEKINDFDSYGTQDLSMIIDQQKKNFPIERILIKEKAKELFNDAKVEDAYMYEGKEGVKVFFEKGRIDILPHSLHIWCKFTDKVTEFCDWLLVEVYQLR
ncbi:MAG: hypothetical protein NPMRIOTA_30007 [Nitrosopumilales archaeon]|nr:MAG: hypothetical protein NPMRIOTA_30007 [Nitrosopumilales archaeon]